MPSRTLRLAPCLALAVACQPVDTVPGDRADAPAWADSAPVGAVAHAPDDSAASGADTASAAPVTRSREGDTIVVRVVGVPDAPTLRLVPELRIGELDGADEYTFGDVDELLPTRDGGVYVWDNLSQSIRRYDAAGRFVRQVGQSGAGPGEYQNVWGMALVDDALVVWDKNTQHAIVYDSAGTHVGSWMPAYPNRGMGELTAGTDGTLYLRHHIEPPTSPDIRVNRLGYVGYDVKGRPTGDTIAQLPYRDVGRWVGTGDARRSASVRVPFTPMAVDRFSPRGYLVSGDGDRYRLVLARRDAPPLRIERDVAPVPVGSDERRVAQEIATAVMRKSFPSWRWDGPAIPSHKPFFDDVRFDTDGRIWIQRLLASTRIPDDEIEDPMPGELPPARWRQTVAYDVFTPDGDFRGTVLRPPRSALLHIRDDVVWGRMRDSLDVPYVMRWRVVPMR